LGSANHYCIFDVSSTSCIITDIKNSIDLDSSKDVVNGLDIYESHSANIFSDNTISSIFIESRVLVVRWDYWIGVIGIFSIVESSFVEYNWLAWEGPWSVFMENSETISTHRMSNIVSKLTQFKSDWTYFTRG
jgi:hypothetical protein